MTTLCSYSQADDLFSLSNNNIHLQDYETVSHLDLFHSSQLESFKDIERQRRATQSHVIKKNKKLEQLRKRNGNNINSSSSSLSISSGSSSASESDQEEQPTKLSGSSSDSDRKKGSKKSIRNAGRSNKRADRHRRPEDEILSSSDDSDSDSDSGYHAASRFTDDEVYEERIRFKRNLNFKTENTQFTQKLNAFEWKQVYVQKLDEKDNHRAQQKELQRQKKHSSRS